MSPRIQIEKLITENRTIFDWKRRVVLSFRPVRRICALMNTSSSSKNRRVQSYSFTGDDARVTYVLQYLRYE
jgi:hypothetical protein